MKKLSSLTASMSANWESDKVFEDLRAGGVTAINATVVTWENFQQTLDPHHRLDEALPRAP